MAMLEGRRFVNIVAMGKYKPGLLSVHRLDVSSKHLFYPSAFQARWPPAAETTTLQELPAPCAIFSDATTAAARRRSRAFFSLVSPRSSEGGGSRILFTNEDGDSIMYDADADEGCHAMPCPGLDEFAGPLVASVSKEESMYIMHGRVARFHVIRFGTPPPPTPTDRSTRRWYWQSLPLPPFVDRPYAVVSSYTVVEGGRTICVSSMAAAGPGTWCFDTVRGEWWHASDWMMPFDGRAEYLADLDLWLGFSSYGSPGRELCTTSGLAVSAMAKNRHQPPTLLQRVWRDGHTPMPTKVELISLGSGRFAIAKVFKSDHGYTSDFRVDDINYMTEDDELLDVTGVEIRPRQPRGGCSDIWSCSDGLELIPHKSISYMCDIHRIHQIL